MTDNTSVKVPFVELSLQHQAIQTEMEQAIHAVLKQGDFILGKAVAEFEKSFAQKCGVEYGIGVANGTEAIAIGLKACGIKEGDQIILPANTFVATLIGVIQAGATPILVDCDLNTALIDLAAAEKLITPKTKAIIPVHLYGQMVSPRELLDFATKYNLIVFEDAAQAHLAEREGYRAGAIGKAAAFSFYPSKNLGALGDGGIVVTNDSIVAQKVRSLRNYGSLRKYFHIELGTNSRLDTLQAAVLNVKLPHLEDWNRSRNLSAQIYDRLLAPLVNRGISPLQNQCNTGHIYHLYVIRISENCTVDRKTLQEKLELQGIQTGIHYPIPCHLQPAFEYLGYQPGNFPNSETLSKEILSLPMYPGLEETQINQVVDAIESVLGVKS